MQSKLKPSFFMMSMPITSLPTKNTEQEPRDHPLLKSIEAFYFFLCNFLLDFCPFYASLQSIRFLRVIAWKKSFSTTRNRKSPTTCPRTLYCRLFRYCRTKIFATVSDVRSLFLCDHCHKCDRNSLLMFAHCLKGYSKCRIYFDISHQFLSYKTDLPGNSV